ncbi:MAG: tetratricopeptide repeat protein [Bdellovibrionales bacterium]|nr:tetratricopeptide repeat protein [Bdellovibrionales bacterium]
MVKKHSVFGEVRKVSHFLLILSLPLAGCAGLISRSEEGQKADENSVVSEPSKEEKKSDASVPQATYAQQVGQKKFQATAEYHFSMAQAYVAEGNPDRAIEEFKIALSYDQNSALIRARLAGEYVKKGELAAALEECRQAIRLDPKYVDAHLLLAGLLSTSRETQAALSQYDKVLKLDPKNEEAVVYKSQILFEDGKAKPAINELKVFVKNNPESVLAHYYLGRGYQREGMTKEAIKSFKQSMELRPSFTQAALALGFLYEENKRQDEALEVYRELYEQSQELAAANRIATLYLKKEDYAAAIPYLEAIQANDPEDLNTRVKLGLVQMEMKNYEKAIQLFSDILKKNPDSDRILYYLGSLYEETKRPDLAIEQLKKIKSDSKLYSDAALHVAYLLKQADKFNDAKVFIADAIQKAPHISGFYLFYASLEEESKNLNQAITILEEASKRFPSDEKVRYYLGSIFDRVNRTDEALVQMEAILGLNPENVDALNYIGYTWTQKGIRLNDAERLLRKAMALRPNNGYIQDSWGWHLFMRGKFNEAIVELEKAVKLKPTESTILEHLGDAYVHQNLREKAFHQYRDAVRFAEDETLKRKIESKLEIIKQELVRMGRPVPGDTPQRAPASASTPPPATQ